MEQTLSPSREATPPLSSTTALWGGIVFAFLFTGLIAVLDYRLDALETTFIPDQGASWYFWQLPNPTLISRASVWILYSLHQVMFWGLIYYAQTRVQTYTKGLHPVNVWALGMNALFLVLHLIQTHLFYDGTAQDVSIWSSQFSVILMLVFILTMENQRRGLFFGKKAPLPQSVVGFLKSYHGYIFSWAAVYTFWYHPMVNTPGHLVGFLYMFFLMLQGSLFLTRAHLNRNWMVTQEVMVLVHGTMVAWYQGNGIWPMFFFGFGFLFVATQVWGLGWPRWAEWGSLAVFILLAVIVYNSDWARLNEIIRIPAIEYIVVFVLAVLFLITAQVINRVLPQKSSGV